MNSFLVVGAGLSGLTIARELADAGHKVVVVDSRNHIGGNAYDYINEKGIRVHKYGPHLFHTNNKEVLKYLSRFTEWIPYEHRVQAQLEDGTYVPFPPNKLTVDIVGGENIIDTFYRPYTKKMWGRPLEEISPSIIARVPKRDDDEDRYFPNDEFQYMPKNGYTYMCENMIDHENITVHVSTPFDYRMEEAGFDHIFNSMPIDEYYSFAHGELEYRSIKFHTHTIPLPHALPATTVNFTNDSVYTRVTEWKNIPGHGSNKTYTTLTFEEPCDYKENNMERYYPIADFINKDRYLKYKAIDNPKMTFIGRCGQYVYIDMHQAVNSALRIAMDFK
ncbi:Glf UDP-galactopyranose mutase [uncultured Caudovirales phage]|uniref:Glf UDP-galactopyranose mutase n=1 Tax=uncultured Caudovirales phage TaxID=2100421 RepID=A0A6J7WUM2_9CAUD|nr:Glf UDP-galactopyranose mutase [uncultured Caudovirales phage]